MGKPSPQLEDTRKVCERFEDDWRWGEHLCEHFIEAARAEGAKAIYDVASARVKVRDGDWGPYYANAEMLIDPIRVLGARGAWRHFRHDVEQREPDGPLLFNGDIARATAAKLCP